MEVFLEWVRNSFILADLMHLADIEDKTLKELMFENGPSRDEFIKFLVYKLLLDIDSEPEDSRNHNLEKIFVTFGLLNKEDAQQFLKGCMSIKMHITTWKRIIEALIPKTTFTYPWSNYDEMIINICEKHNFFQSVQKKKYVPPELISKLNAQTSLNENNESIEEISEKLINMISKPIRSDESNSQNLLLNSEEKLDSNLEFMDLDSIKKEIDLYLKISNDNKISSTNIEQSVKISPQEFVETKQHNLIHTDVLESKVDEIYKFMKAEKDLQLLASGLAYQIIYFSVFQMSIQEYKNLLNLKQTQPSHYL